jgi:hypothetical protein
VFTTSHLRRSAQLLAIACALLVPAATANAAADPLRAPERYYMSFAPAEEPRGPVAQEQYYSSYGDPKPLSAPQSPPPSNDTPWIALTLSIAGALAIVAVSATQLRRIRVRRRRPAHTAA